MGPAHPNWKHGRHSKFLPKGLAARYEVAARDPDLTSLRDEVVLVDVRIGQLLESLGQTGSGRLWKEARQKFDAFKGASGKGKNAVGAARLALQELDDVLAQGLTAAATWDELRETLDLRRRLSDSETKRLKDLHQMISIERAWALLRALLIVVKDHVTDRDALAAITDQFGRLVGRPGGEIPAA